MRWILVAFFGAFLPLIGVQSASAAPSKKAAPLIDMSSEAKAIETMPQYIDLVTRNSELVETSLATMGEAVLAQRPKHYMGADVGDYFKTLFNYTMEDFQNFGMCNGVDDVNKRKTPPMTIFQLAIPPMTISFCPAPVLKFTYHKFLGIPAGIAIRFEFTMCGWFPALRVRVADIIKYFFPSQHNTARLNLKADALILQPLMKATLQANRKVMASSLAFAGAGTEMAVNLANSSLKTLGIKEFALSKGEISQEAAQKLAMIPSMTDDQLFNPAPGVLTESWGLSHFTLLDVISQLVDYIPHVGKISHFNKGGAFGFMASRSFPFSVAPDLLAVSPVRARRFMNFTGPFGIFLNCLADKKVAREGGPRAFPEALSIIPAKANADLCLAHVGKNMFPFLSRSGAQGVSDPVFHGLFNTLELGNLAAQIGMAFNMHSWWRAYDRYRKQEGEVAENTKECEIQKAYGFKPWEREGGDKRALADPGFNSWSFYEYFAGVTGFKGDDFQKDWDLHFCFPLPGKMPCKPRVDKEIVPKDYEST